MDYVHLDRLLLLIKFLIEHKTMKYILKLKWNWGRQNTWLFGPCSPRPSTPISGPWPLATGLSPHKSFTKLKLPLVGMFGLSGLQVAVFISSPRHSVLKKVSLTSTASYWKSSHYDQVHFTGLLVNHLDLLMSQVHALTLLCMGVLR